MNIPAWLARALARITTPHPPAPAPLPPVDETDPLTAACAELATAHTTTDGYTANDLAAQITTEASTITDPAAYRDRLRDRFLHVYNHGDYLPENAHLLRTIAVLRGNTSL